MPHHHGRSPSRSRRNRGSAANGQMCQFRTHAMQQVGAKPHPSSITVCDAVSRQAGHSQRRVASGLGVLFFNVRSARRFSTSSMLGRACEACWLSQSSNRGRMQRERRLQGSRARGLCASTPRRRGPTAARTWPRRRSSQRMHRPRPQSAGQWIGFSWEATLPAYLLRSDRLRESDYAWT